MHGAIVYENVQKSIPHINDLSRAEKHFFIIFIRTGEKKMYIDQL